MVVQRLEELTKSLRQKGMPISLSINDNRHTFVSVKWEKEEAKVSLHRIFLDAPKDVLEGIISYVTNKKKKLGYSVLAYIERQRATLDYSYLIDQKKLAVVGDVYHIKEIYDSLNAKFFDGLLNLSICWFGSRFQKNRFRTSLGLYYDTLKLIKVHRLLDNKMVPQFVVEYVIYHEMLHAVCPSYLDKKGILKSHSTTFHHLEESFPDYQEAKEWIKQNQTNFFLYVRTQ